MSWICVADRRGTGWHVNLDAVKQILYAREFAKKKKSRARIVVENEEFNLQRVAINYRGMQAAVLEETRRKYRRFQDKLYRNASEAYEMLTNAHRRAILLERSVYRMQQSASTVTTRNIDAGTRRGERWVTALTVTRDASASILVIGATLITGGAAAGMVTGASAGSAGAWAVSSLTTGSVLTGIGTYEDTGNVGQALLTGSTTFFVGMIPMGGGAAAAGNVAATRAVVVVGVVANAGTGTAVSLASGLDTRTSVNETIVDSIGSELASQVTESFVDTLPLPIQAIANHGISQLSGQVSQAASDRLLNRPSEQTVEPNIRGCITAGASLPRTTYNDNYIQLYVMRQIRDMQPWQGNGRTLARQLRNAAEADR